MEKHGDAKFCISGWFAHSRCHGRRQIEAVGRSMERRSSPRGLRGDGGAACLDFRPPRVDGDVAAPAKFFGRDRFIALVRPDRIVGWVGQGENVDLHACGAALGDRSLTPETM